MKKKIKQIAILFVAFVVNFSFASCESNEPDTTQSGNGGSGSNSNGTTVSKRLEAYRYIEYDNGAVEDWEDYTGDYDSSGRVLKIVASEGGEEDYLDFVWNGNKVRNIQYDTEFVLNNNRVVGIYSDEEQITLEYNASNQLVKVSERDSYGSNITTLQWDGDKFVGWREGDGEYTKTYTFDYSIEKEGIGFFNTWACEISERIEEIGLFLVHPELYGFGGVVKLPYRMIRTIAGDVEVTTFDYTIQDGYITEMWSMESDEEYGTFKCHHVLTWK